MLIYDALKQDHEVLRDLLDLLAQRDESSLRMRRDRLEALREEWIAHARAEEAVLYEALKRETIQLGDLVLEGYEQHSTGETLIRELELMSSTDARFYAKLSQLKIEFDRNMELEELALFDLARENLEPELAEVMAREYRHIKETLREGSMAAALFKATTPVLPARLAARWVAKVARPTQSESVFVSRIRRILN